MRPRVLFTGQSSICSTFAHTGSGHSFRRMALRILWIEPIRRPSISSSTAASLKTWGARVPWCHLRSSTDIQMEGLEVDQNPISWLSQAVADEVRPTWVMCRRPGSVHGSQRSARVFEGRQTGSMAVELLVFEQERTAVRSGMTRLGTTQHVEKREMSVLSTAHDTAVGSKGTTNVHRLCPESPKSSFQGALRAQRRVACLILPTCLAL